MKTIALIVAGALPLAVAFGAHAKLPPLTPEEITALEQKRALEQESIKREQQSLTRVQEDVAARYRREHPGAGAPQPSGQTAKEDIPRAARETPRDAGPHGRDEPGAEAHSAPAGTPQPPRR